MGVSSFNLSPARRGFFSFAATPGTGRGRGTQALLSAVKKRYACGMDRFFNLQLRAAALLFGLLVPAAATAADCKPDALGVSRVIAVDPAEHGRIGTMQYPETLPLNDHEVVLT